MRITLYVFMKGLAIAIKDGHKTYHGNFNRGQWEVDQYAEMSFDIGEVSFTQGATSASFVIPKELKMKMTPAETFPPIDPAPHVANI